MTYRESVAPFITHSVMGSRISSKIVKSLYRKTGGDPIAFGEALLTNDEIPVRANFSTPAWLMIDHRLISDLLNVDIHDRSKRITEERYQHKRRYKQDPGVLPKYTLHELILMQNHVSKLWSSGSIPCLIGSPDSYTVYSKKYIKVYKRNINFLDQETKTMNVLKGPKCKFQTHWLSLLVPER